MELGTSKGWGTRARGWWRLVKTHPTRARIVVKDRLSWEAADALKLHCYDAMPEADLRAGWDYVVERMPR